MNLDGDRRRNGPRSGESPRQPGQHHEVGVKLDTLRATSAQGGKPVVVLQASKLALYGNAAAVQVFEPLAVSGDAREQPTAERERQGYLVGLRAFNRDIRLNPASLALVMDADAVVRLVSRDRLGLVPASMERVQQGGDEQGFVARAVATSQASGRPVAVQTAAGELPLSA